MMKPYSIFDQIILKMSESIAIPLPRSGGEILTIRLDELPDNISTILRMEMAPLDTWLECSKILLMQGRIDTYARLLQDAIDEASAQQYHSPHAKYVLIKALCSLADLHVQQGRLAEDREKRQQLFGQAQKHYFRAQKVDNLELLPHIGLGEMALLSVCFSCAATSRLARFRISCDQTLITHHPREGKTKLSLLRRISIH